MQNAGILQLQQHGRPSGLKFDWRIRNEKESFGSAPYSEHDGSHAGRVRKQYSGFPGGRRKRAAGAEGTAASPAAEAGHKPHRQKREKA